MTKRDRRDLPLHVDDYVETPPTRSSNRRKIDELEETTTVFPDDLIILQRGGKTFRIDAGKIAPVGYGEIYTQDGQNQSPAVTQTPGTSPVLYTGFTENGLSKYITPDHTADKLTVEYAGVYSIDIQVSFSGSNSTTFHFQLQRDLDGTPTETHIHADRRLGQSGDVGSVSFTGYLSLTAGESIGVYITGEAGATINTHEAQLTVHRING